METVKIIRLSFLVIQSIQFKESYLKNIAYIYLQLFISYKQKI